MKVLFDTSIIIDYLRGANEARDALVKVKAGELDAYVSALTEAELLAGKECNEERKRQEIHAIIGLFTKQNIDNNVAQMAGELKRKYRIPLDDCLIAATALILGATVWTKNIKEFGIIREVKSEEPY